MAWPSSLDTADGVLHMWAITRSTKLARMEFVLAHAESAGRTGDLKTARAVLLEAIGHVAPDDARLHVLLGQVAIARHDRKELQEVQDYLRFLQLPEAADGLQALAMSGAPAWRSVKP